MTDEQFRELKQMILALSARVMELEGHLKRQDEIADHRQDLIYQWCAPDSYKIKVERITDTLEVGIPEDLKKFLPGN